ncbi:hypothetical protein SAMN04488063_2039 [Halopelagius inordinatus]|uniref:Uncharacterized protein n=1 Tax=Halopelagius inordinatus TaxID=553467 RepID=A0A1I2RT19_9EURY|nr:hypothetical protein [Halopelagius inordinatus]SFG43600.1 hypothetical protein SAMN04488063_2039 [Halopelagius inordinatus]
MSQTTSETNGKAHGGARTGRIATGAGNPTEPQAPTAAIIEARAPRTSFRPESLGEEHRADSTGAFGWSP